MANFLELQDEVLRRLEEVTGSPIVFTETELREAINEGYEDISERTEWNETNQTLSISTQYTDLRASLTLEWLSITKAYNSGIARWLRWTSWRNLDQWDFRWSTVTGTPDKMFLRGVTQLGLYPTPTSATSIKIFHTALPARMVADTDVPGFPREFHPAIVQYALYDLFSQDGETTHALLHWIQYLKIEREFNIWVQDRLHLAREKVYGDDLTVHTN